MGFPNLGIALGAGVDEMNRQRANDRADRSLQMQEESHLAQMNQVKRQNEEYEAAKKVFADALPVFQGGWQKAAEHLAERYNANDEGIGYNDGKQVKVQVGPNGVYVTPLNPDGSGGTTAFYTPQDVMREHVMATHARLATINDGYGKQFLSWLDAAARAELDRAERSEKDAYGRGRDAVRDKQIEQELEIKRQRTGILEAQANRAPRGLTPQQERLNLEIDAARSALAGLDQEEVKRRTANFTATGRENPEYDERIESAMKLAGRRKIGDDDFFDSRVRPRDSAEARGSIGSGTDFSGAAPGYSESTQKQDRADIAKRFRADRAMDNYRLGRDTPNGVEVLDKAGKVIGHFD